MGEKCPVDYQKKYNVRARFKDIRFISVYMLDAHFQFTYKMPDWNSRNVEKDSICISVRAWQL